MIYNQPLQRACLVRRYKRFLADVDLADGTLLTVHCPNSGSMLGCQEPGIEVCISRSDNPKRKYPHTLELVRPNMSWVGINTSRTNSLVKEALENGIIKEFSHLSSIQAEVKTSAHTRLDFLLHTHNEQKIYLEVKNCTLVEEKYAMFPDAVTTRGTKHLNELIELKNSGHGAAVLFCVQRSDAHRFAPASHIDPVYAEHLHTASEKGVMILAYQADVTTTGTHIVHSLPVDLHRKE